MEKLKAYIATTGIKHSHLAAKVGVAPSTISDFLSGYRTPSLATAGRIAAATKGKVPVSAWLKSSRA